MLTARLTLRIGFSTYVYFPYCYIPSWGRICISLWNQEAKRSWVNIRGIEVKGCRLHLSLLRESEIDRGRKMNVQGDQKRSVDKSFKYTLPLKSTEWLHLGQSKAYSNSRIWSASGFERNDFQYPTASHRFHVRPRVNINCYIFSLNADRTFLFKYKRRENIFVLPGSRWCDLLERKLDVPPFREKFCCFW